MEKTKRKKVRTVGRKYAINGRKSDRADFFEKEKKANVSLQAKKRRKTIIDGKSFLRHLVDMIVNVWQ